jgi:hypothetical protein
VCMHTSSLQMEYACLQDELLLPSELEFCSCTSDDQIGIDPLSHILSWNKERVETVHVLLSCNLYW